MWRDVVDFSVPDEYDCNSFYVQKLMDPIISRFRFHFRTKQKTNRVDKPEYFYTFITKTMKDIDVVLSVVQEICDELDFEQNVRVCCFWFLIID